MALFDALLSIHRMGHEDRRLLEAAALLHDLGHRVSPRAHHKHSRDLVLAMNLTGFSRNESLIIACIARYHRKAHPKSTHPVYSELSGSDQQRVCRLAGILRIADGLDRSHSASCKRINAEHKTDSIALNVTQRELNHMDIAGARRKCGLFEEAFSMKVIVRSVSSSSETKKRMRKSILIVAALILFTGCATTLHARETRIRLQPGDLLFQDLDAGPLCDAIETVTQGVDGAKFSHVGMVSRVGDDAVHIIEAVGAGVVETSLGDFLGRSFDESGQPKVLVGRLEDIDKQVKARAVDVARGFLGRPYDTVFTMENSTFYCSELLYESFRVANGGVALFDLYPMTFLDPTTGHTFPAWTEYYTELATGIPEGMPGLNPGGMSRSSHITIIHAYGSPAGWRGTLELAP